MQSHSCQRVLASSKTTKSKQRLFHFSLCRNHFISTSTSLPLPLPLLPLLFHFHFNFISTLSFLAGTIFLGLRIEIQWSFFTGIPYIFLIFILYVYVWWGCFLAFLFYDSGYHPVSNPFIHCFLGFLVPLAFCFPFCNYTRGSVHDSVFSFFCKFSIFCGCWVFEGMHIPLHSEDFSFHSSLVWWDFASVYASIETNWICVLSC